MIAKTDIGARLGQRHCLSRSAAVGDCLDFRVQWPNALANAVAQAAAVMVKTAAVKTAMGRGEAGYSSRYKCLATSRSG
jgi:hypothetical protein